MKELVKVGADFNAATDDGVSALTHACQNGHLDTAMALADLGADLTAAGANGVSLAELFEARCGLPFAELEAQAERARRRRERLPLAAWRRALETARLREARRLSAGDGSEP
jgi:hypothetical protein